MQIDITPEYLASQGLSKTFAERFWKYVNKNGPIPEHQPHLGNCWLWTAYVRPGGYGTIARGSTYHRTISAHIASWILHCGPVPAGMCVCHSCDTRDCVRWDHLFIGTQLDNIDDYLKKKRNPRGERHGMAKLTQDQVDEIRRRYVKGENKSNRGNREQLMKEFGICFNNFFFIVNRETWKDH